MIVFGNQAGDRLVPQALDFQRRLHENGAAKIVACTIKRLASKGSIFAARPR
jgi:hypothetical protein